MSKNDDESKQFVRGDDHLTEQQKTLLSVKKQIRKSADVQDAKKIVQDRVKSIGQQFLNLKSKAMSRRGLDTSSDVTEASEQSLPRSDADESQQCISYPSVHLSTSTISAREFDSSGQSEEFEMTPGSLNVTPRSERMQLLRRQMKETKLLMAQRTTSQVHLQQKVIELRNKLNSATALGRSMNDLGVIGSAAGACATEDYDRHKSATDLASQPFNLDKERIKFLDNRCRLLEKQLEKERQSNKARYASKEEEPAIAHIDAASLAKENEQLRSEVRNLQEKQDAEPNEKDEQSGLREELRQKRNRIIELEEVNDVLETARSDLSNKQLESEQLIEQLQSEVQAANERLQQATEPQQEDGDALAAATMQRNTDSQVKEEMAKQIQELHDELEQLKRENVLLRDAISDGEKLEVSDANIADKIAALEATIESQRDDLQTRMQSLQKCEEDLMEKTIELNVLNANFKVLEEKLDGSSRHKALFSSAGDGSDSAAAETQAAELYQLKQKLDESNKAMIKLKLKSKQTEKQMEKLTKLSDGHAEIVRLEKANEQLQQKITELEDEKGQWQLAHVDEDAAPHSPSQSAGVSEPQPQLEELCKTQAETIRLLEQQKFEQNEKLDATMRDLQALQELLSTSEETTRVKSQMSEIHLEEQLEEQAQLIDSLQTRLVALEREADELRTQVEDERTEREAVDKKLERYMTENIELLEKVEKLSKSSSSAESIEIVERLTQQERAEIDEFNSRHEQDTPRSSSPRVGRSVTAAASSVSELTQTEMGPELSDILTKLREESSELMSKIALFTTERREVLEKMEHLTADNQELLRRVDELTEQKELCETNALLAEDARSKLEGRLQELAREKERLATQVAESSAHRSQLSQELTSMQTSTELVASLDGAEGATLFDKCEKSLSKLNSELESYRRANDKNAKFNACKKLAKEAKNAYTQLSELLVKVKEASSAVETVTVVETVVAVTAPNGKALAEYEQLTAQNRELKATVAELRRELERDARDVPLPESPTPSGEVPAIEPVAETAADARQQQLAEYEEQCLELQSTVEDLRRELREARLAEHEKQESIAELNDELETMRKLSDDFDCLINKKAMSHEKQVEQLTRVKRELEGKCETYEAEMEILQTLIAEQKQQLIEAYKGGEHEMNLKLLELQQNEQEIARLRDELALLKEQSAAMAAVEATSTTATDQQQEEMAKVREKLRINKALVERQLMELSNKQETIDTLNQQLIELYKTMQENENKLVEKEDQVADMQGLLDANNKELDRLRKDNREQKSVVDKLLNELHSHRANSQLVPQLETDLQRLASANAELDRANKELEQRNKEQLEKLKKYAANLKKRTTHCLDLESRLKTLEQGVATLAVVTQDVGVSAGDDNHRSHQQLPREVGTITVEQLVADNQALRDQLAQIELRLNESETAARTIQEALQLKTVELLDKMEQGTSLESKLEQLQANLEQKTLETVQLQNALAASQEQETSDWGGNSRDKTEAGEAAQLSQQLADKTISLERADAALNAVQDEVLRLREVEREQQQRLAELADELRAKAAKFEKSKVVIKDRNGQIARLQAQLKDVQDKLCAQPEEEAEAVVEPLVAPTIAQAPLAAGANQAAMVPQAQFDALQQSHDKLLATYQTEKSNFLQTIERLETLHDGIQAKLQEDMAYIETLEQDNAKFREKICKLEDCVAMFEERRASMERRANLLHSQMQTRADEYEKTEDALVYRLNALSEHDDVIAQRLLDSQEEKEELQEQLDRLQAEFNALNGKQAKLEKDHQAYQEQMAATLEARDATLREQLATSAAETIRLCSQYDAKLAAKTTEIDELESDLSDQLEKMNAEKRSMAEECERARDEASALKDEMVRVYESVTALEQSRHELEREATWLRMENANSQQELQDMRMQTMQDKTENDNLRSQIETLAGNHELELQGLRTQISELDTLRMQVGQNQTDDQVFIETENKRLTDLLAEKEALIESYQRQNLQLQMAAAATAQAAPPLAHVQPDPFALTFGLPPAPAAPQTMALPTDERARFEHDLAEKGDQILRLQRDAASLQADLQSLQAGNSELQRLLAERERDVDHLRSANTTPAPVSASASSDVIIAAPPAFFGFDQQQMVASPFDDIVRTTALETGSAARPSPANDSSERATIADLQRNVCDLEKHAQDLENKLAMRNQREGDYEERMQAIQARVHEAESALRDREHQLQQALMEQQRLQQQLLEQQRTASDQAAGQHQQLEQLQSQVQQLEAQLASANASSTNTTSAFDQDSSALGALESQILPTSPPDDSFERQLPTLNMFFGGATSTPECEKLVSGGGGGDQPVVEELIVPERSYLCQPEEARSSQAEVHNLGDDDWGDTWGGGAAPAILDETIPSPVLNNNSSSITLDWTPPLLREQLQEIQLQEAEARVRDLETQLALSEQQRQEAQAKSAKMMKKLKEYKAKNEELSGQVAAAAGSNDAFRKSASVESNSFFGDLDMTIQEELKAQIVKLEALLAEERKAQAHVAAEKEKLLKRIDVLTAGNERMAEMKERQDMDVRMYQARMQDLQAKLDRLDEWRDESRVVNAAAQTTTAPSPTVGTQFNSQATADLEKQIAELSAELRDVCDDRQELQAQLDDERANVERAEQTVRALQEKQLAVDSAAGLNETLIELTAKYNDVRLENQKLLDACRTTRDELGVLQTLHREQKQHNQVEIMEAKQIAELRQLEAQSLRASLQNAEEIGGELQAQSLALRTQNQELVQAHEERLRALADECGELRVQKAAIATELAELRQQTEVMRQQQETQTSASPSPLPHSHQLHNDELSAKLQEREAEIFHLKQRIEDLMREDQTEKLVLEILTKNQEIHMLKMQVKHLEDDKLELEQNLSQQLANAMASTRAAVEEGGQAVEERSRQLEQSVLALESERKSMEEELKELNNHVMASLDLEDKMKALVLQLDAKNIEVGELRKSLEALKAANASSPAGGGDGVATNIAALNAQWEIAAEQRCAEIAQRWREHLESRELDFKRSEAGLLEEIALLRTAASGGKMPPTADDGHHGGISGETSAATTTAASEASSSVVSGTSSAAPSKENTPLHAHIRSGRPHADDLGERAVETNTAEEDGVIIEKMQAALESQEMEIVTLKEQLAIRSAEYARLAAQYDPFKLQTTLSHSGMNLDAHTQSTSPQVAKRAATSGTGGGSGGGGGIGGIAGDVVPKSELDFALYTLYQRDMRYEEMKLELVSLMEERDTLQLKLSHTLRQLEEIKVQCNYVEPAPAQTDVAITGPTAASGQVEAVAQTAVVAASTIAEDELSQKLSQLQTGNHSRDKVSMEEHEQRLRHMEQDVAKMPHAAVTELIGVDLSAQSNQSPSSVLMNWFWGNNKSNSPGGGSGGGTGIGGSGIGPMPNN